MDRHSFRTAASRQYGEAHSMHHQANDLLGAIKVYQDVMVTFPDSREASYSRTQILNIVTSVVPERELFDALLKLAMAKFELEKV